MDFEIKPQPMVSGVPGDMTFYLHVGVSGLFWLVGNVPNAADHIYRSSAGKSEGFAGRNIEFNLGDGNSISLQGPWKSNSESLRADTEIDITNKYNTFGVISKEVRGNTMIDVVYIDNYFVIGRLNRIKEFCSHMSEQMGGRLYYYQQTYDKSTRGQAS